MAKLNEYFEVEGHLEIPKIVNGDSYGTIWKMEKNLYTSLHYHRNVDEDFVVREGNILVYLWPLKISSKDISWANIDPNDYNPGRLKNMLGKSRESNLTKGMSIKIPSGTPHKILCLEDSELLMFSPRIPKKDYFIIENWGKNEEQ